LWNFKEIAFDKSKSSPPVYILCTLKTLVQLNIELEQQGIF